MLDILLEVYPRAIYNERNSRNRMVHNSLHVRAEHDLELCLSGAKGNIVLLAKGQGELEETIEVVQIIGDYHGVISLANGRYHKIVTKGDTKSRVLSSHKLMFSNIL